MTNGMPIGTGIPFPQGIQSDSACPRLEDTLASTVGTKAIHRLRGRWRGPERFGRSDAFLDYRRVSLLVPLRQQEFCPGPALGMGAERVFRAGRCSHHRLQGAFLPAWYRCDRRGRRHQGHGRNRSLGSLHRFGLDNLTIPMLHFLATRASPGSGWIISPSQCSTSWRRARLRIRAAPARPIISKEPPPNAQSNAGSVRASEDAGGACLSGAAGAAGATASANGADDAGAAGAGDGASRCAKGSDRCGAETGSVRAIVRPAGLDALRFTGAAAGTACASSACDAVMAASNRCSTEGVDWTTGWEGAKTGAGDAAGCVCATGGSAITGCAGGMTVCANSVGELIARTAAIAALAGRSERICPVIANVQPVSCGFKRNSCSLFRISRANSRTE